MFHQFKRFYTNSRKWIFESPSLFIYNIEKGSCWSIIVRMMLFWNFGNLIFEYVFYPYDLSTIIKEKKRKLE